MPFNFIGNKLWTFDEPPPQRSRAGLAGAATASRLGRRRRRLPSRCSEQRAIAIAEEDANAPRGAGRAPRTCAPRRAEPTTTATGRSASSPATSEVVQVIVDDQTGEIEESWTGDQVAWRDGSRLRGRLRPHAQRALHLAAALRDLRPRPARLAPPAPDGPPRPARDRRRLRRSRTSSSTGARSASRSRSPIPPWSTCSAGRSGSRSRPRAPGLRPLLPLTALAVATLFLIGVRGRPQRGRLERRSTSATRG